MPKRIRIFMSDPSKLYTYYRVEFENVRDLEIILRIWMGEFICLNNSYVNRFYSVIKKFQFYN